MSMRVYEKMMITLVSTIVFFFVGQTDYWFQAIVVYMAIFLCLWVDEIDRMLN